jgi:hypothetical protein
LEQLTLTLMLTLIAVEELVATALADRLAAPPIGLDHLVVGKLAEKLSHHLCWSIQPTQEVICKLIGPSVKF